MHYYCAKCILELAGPPAATFAACRAASGAAFPVRLVCPWHELESRAHADPAHPPRRAHADPPTRRARAVCAPQSSFGHGVHQGDHAHHRARRDRQAVARDRPGAGPAGRQHDGVLQGAAPTIIHSGAHGETQPTGRARRTHTGGGRRRGSGCWVGLSSAHGCTRTVARSLLPPPLPPWRRRPLARSLHAAPRARRTSTPRRPRSRRRRSCASS